MISFCSWAWGSFSKCMKLSNKTLLQIILVCWQWYHSCLSSTGRPIKVQGQRLLLNQQAGRIYSRQWHLTSSNSTLGNLSLLRRKAKALGLSRDQWRQKEGGANHSHFSSTKSYRKTTSNTDKCLNALENQCLGKNSLGIKWNGIKTNAEIYQIAEQPLVSKATQLRRRMTGTKRKNMCHRRQEQEHVKETIKKPFCWLSITDKLTNVPFSWGAEQAEPCSGVSTGKPVCTLSQSHCHGGGEDPAETPARSYLELQCFSIWPAGM